MSCEEELNALREAQRELAAFRKQHFGTGDSPPGAEVIHRVAELTTAVTERQAAYNRCRGGIDSPTSIESLMRDETGAPLGGGAGPPM